MGFGYRGPFFSTGFCVHRHQGERLIALDPALPSSASDHHDPGRAITIKCGEKKSLGRPL